jgi:hypothetical protein
MKIKFQYPVYYTVYTRYIPRIYLLSEYTWYIRGIYLLYTSSGFQMPLDLTTRTALPACTCLDPQPLARDPAGAGGVVLANQGWIRPGLKAETTDEPSLNGPGPRFCCIGQYRYIRSLPMSRWDLMPFLDRPFKGSETGELQSTSKMRFPTHWQVTINTSDTYARLCVSEYSCRNMPYQASRMLVPRTGRLYSGGTSLPVRLNLNHDHISDPA